MEEEYITLKQAARLAGYHSAGMLHLAVREGRLKTVKPEKGVLLTTRAWLEEYRQTLSPGSRHRGAYTTAADEAGE